MKRMISLIAIAALVSFTASAKVPIAKGKTFSSLGGYIVEKSDNPITIDGKELKTYLISYENSDMMVRVGIDKSDRKCINYIVVSDELSIKYQCNGRVFGVSKLDKKYRNDGLDRNIDNIDRNEYFHQKVLTQIERTPLEHVKLISVFYPKLISDYEKVLAVK